MPRILIFLNLGRCEIRQKSRGNQETVAALALEALEAGRAAACVTLDGILDVPQEQHGLPAVDDAVVVPDKASDHGRVMYLQLLAPRGRHVVLQCHDIVAGRNVAKTYQKS